MLVGGGGRATLQDAINFLLSLLITLRMLAEQTPSPGKSGGGRFMTCYKEVQAFSHHLFIAHGLAIFVSDLQQDGEEVISLCRAVTPLVNEAPNAVAQNLYGFAGATITWQRPMVW